VALLANTKFADDVQITLRVDSAKIVEQSSSAADPCQQAFATCVVLLVRSHVLGQVIDPSGQDGNLDLWRTGVSIRPLVLLD